MFKKPTFEDNIYMKLIRWGYLLLVANLCFVVAMLPFALAALFLAIDLRNLFPFALSLLFVGPALIATCGYLDDFKRELEIDAPVKTFFKYWLRFGRRGLIYWLVGWSGSIVAVADISFFVNLPNGKWLTPFFMLLAILASAVSINCWYFQIRNPEKGLKDVFRISLFYAIRKWYFSLLNVLLLGILLSLMVLKPQFGFLLTPVLFAGLIYLNTGLLHKKSVHPA